MPVLTVEQRLNDLESRVHTAVLDDFDKRLTHLEMLTFGTTAPPPMVNANGEPITEAPPAKAHDEHGNPIEQNATEQTEANADDAPTDVTEHLKPQ